MIEDKFVDNIGIAIENLMATAQTFNLDLRTIEISCDQFSELVREVVNPNYVINGFEISIIFTSSFGPVEVKPR